LAKNISFDVGYSLICPAIFAVHDKKKKGPKAKKALEGKEREGDWEVCEVTRRYISAICGVWADTIK